MVQVKPEALRSSPRRRDSEQPPPMLVRATVNHALAHFDDLFVIVWRVATTVEGARELRTECEKFASTRPEGIGLIVVIDTRAPMPNKDAREAVAAFLKSGSGYIKASAVIFEGNALQSSAARGVATGMALLARQSFPQRFFTDTTQAMAFLEKSLRPHTPGPNAADMTISLMRVHNLVADWDRVRH
jgi:hypothetical protein